MQKTVWGLIRRRHAGGATVVVATRSVSEAEALADRAALISHGRIKCCGSPTFIRKLFGLGYRLHVTFQKNPRAAAAATASSETLGYGLEASDYSLNVISTVRAHVPGAEALRGRPADHCDNGITLSLAAGASAGGVHSSTAAVAVRLGPMLADLEECADRFNIADVALEATSLDEVFAQLGQEAEQESETLLPLDASAVALDFGEGDGGGESLGVGLLSSSEGDVNVDVGGGGAGGGGSANVGGGVRQRHGHKGIHGGGFESWARNTRALAFARISGYYRAPAATALLYLTPACLALGCLLLQSSAARAFAEQKIVLWGDWVSPGFDASHGGRRGGIPVTFTSPLQIAEGAAAVMSAAFGGDTEAIAAAAEAGRLVNASAALVQPGALHVTFDAVSLEACAVSATVLYDPLADVHVLPRVVSALHTAVIRATASAHDLHTLAAHVNVTAAAVPLPHESPFGHAWSYMAAMAPPLTMIYIPVAAAAYATSERIGPHRLSLAISGLSSTSYWAATFAVDVFMALGCAFTVAAVGGSMNVAPWDPAAAPASLAVLVSAIPALLLSSYAASFTFGDPGATSTSVSIALHFAGLFLLFVLIAMPEDEPVTRHYHTFASAVVPSYTLNPKP